jgi:hypothetical protein
MGKTCQVDKCADGAYCCDDTPTINECDRLGYLGECDLLGDNAYSYCASGSIKGANCDAVTPGYVCRYTGPDGRVTCDAPPREDICDGVTGIGYNGECDTTNNIARYCSGGVYKEINCNIDVGSKCQPIDSSDSCADHAACCKRP